MADIIGLYEPYSGKATFQVVVAWLEAEANRRRVDPEAIELAFAQVFLEMDEGKKFSVDGCDCGCGMKNPQTHFVHYLKSKMIEINEELQAKKNQKLIARLNKRLDNRYDSKSHLWVWVSAVIVIGVALIGIKLWL